MAEKGFGVKEVNLIGASGTPTIESPNNLNLNANNVAISTNVSIGGTLSVTGNVSVGGTLTYEDVTSIDSIGIITARDHVVVGGGLSVVGISTLSNIVKIMSGLDLQTNGTLDIIGSTSSSGLDIQSNASVQIGQNGFPNRDYATFTDTGVNLNYSGSTKLATTNTGVNVTGAITVNGSALSITPTNTDVQVVYEVTANGSSAYRFAGNGVVSTADNPDLYFIRGQKYRFINNSGGSHPFQIREASGGTAYGTGVTNNGASSGNIDFAPTYDSPAQLVYQCTSHGGMVGNIYLRDAAGNNTNIGITTFSGFVNVNGNFGLETSSPVAQTTSGSVALTPVLDLKGTGSLANASGVLQFTRKDNATQGSCIYSAGEDAGLTFRNTDGNGFGFYNGTSLSARIYPSGQVGINRDTTPLNGVKLMVQNDTNNVFYAYHEGTGNNYTMLCRNDRASGSTQATQIIFLGSGNTYVGDIKSNGSSTSYNTSSDYRLKENVTNISDGITRLKTLKPSRFNFITNPSQTVDGFLAHEVTAVPEAISGTKDEVVTQAMIDNGDAPSDSKLNDPIYQQIDQAKLVPLLTAALQEAVAKIETLESKVATLEGS